MDKEAAVVALGAWRIEWQHDASPDESWLLWCGESEGLAFSKGEVID